MGQQQLLLVILVTIIVGIATVVAINTFSSAMSSSNKDAVRTDLATIATNAHAYYAKPKMLGGGGHSFDGFTFHTIAFPATEVTEDGLHARNANGIYHIYSATASALGIYGEPIVEISESVDINSLVSDSDYFAVTISSDSLIWSHTF